MSAHSFLHVESRASPGTTTRIHSWDLAVAMLWPRCKSSQAISQRLVCRVQGVHCPALHRKAAEPRGVKKELSFSKWSLWGWPAHVGKGNGAGRLRMLPLGASARRPTGFLRAWWPPEWHWPHGPWDLREIPGWAGMAVSLAGCTRMAGEAAWGLAAAGPSLPEVSSLTQCVEPIFRGCRHLEVGATRASRGLKCLQCLCLCFPAAYMQEAAASSSGRHRAEGCVWLVLAHLSWKQVSWCTL